MKRSLTLKKESLAPLTADELGAVAGGDGPTITCIPCLVIITTRLTEQHSLLYPTDCCAVRGA